MANSLAALVLGVACSAAGIRFVQDTTRVFVDAPRSIVPAGHVEQVAIVRKHVAAGSTILYLMDTLDAWQFGLWQRSLYPDYTVVAVVGMQEWKSPAIRALVQKEHVVFAVSAGNPPLNPDFGWQLALPAYPAGIPVILGKLGPR